MADHPAIDLELETNEDAAQTSLDIAQGRGHKAYCTTLQGLLKSATSSSGGGGGGGGSGGLDGGGGGGGGGKGGSSSSAVQAASSAMKVPVAAGDKLCNICFSNEHDAGTMGVSCDEDHFICQECFSAYVQSESNTKDNPQNVVLNGGRIYCPQKKASTCASGAFANKLIAMVVSDELYEAYLQARDFVVGKEAVAGALAKVKDATALGAVEQEQIRNLYKKADGTYAAYQCLKCKFGPIDHMACSDLKSHHGEQKGDGSSINNGCPKCGWFASDISLWPEWDGQFLAEYQADPNVQDMSGSDMSDDERWYCPRCFNSGDETCTDSEHDENDYDYQRTSMCSGCAGVYREEKRKRKATKATVSLNGKQICFTGTLQMKRDDAKAQAEAAGAKVTGSVSANTDILVCGAGVGAKKTDDAQKKGVEVWTEDQFTSVFHVTSSHMSHHHICHIITYVTSSYT